MVASIGKHRAEKLTHIRIIFNNKNIKRTIASYF